MEADRGAPTVLGLRMTEDGVSVRGLAEQVKYNKDTIQRLRTGKQSACPEALGRRIEKALQAEAGSLFEYTKVYRKPVAVAIRRAA